MKNIPTDLLRAFVTVVDLKGFTRAGERLGRSQPAISLQIKRLQDLLGVALFDRETGAVSLTEQGQLVAVYARRMLALNDELATRLGGQVNLSRLKLGMPYDYANFILPGIFGGEGANPASYDVTTDLSVNLLTQLRSGQLDVVVAASPDAMAEGALMSWRDPLCWVGRRDRFAEFPGALPLLVYQEGCVYRRLMLNTLSLEGRSYEIVYTNPIMAGLNSAIQTGFGVTIQSRRVCPPDFPILEDADGFPTLPDMVMGIYVRNDDARPETLQLAQRIGRLFGQEPAAEA